ncbi:MAG: EAL domain-containing protein [Deltaproteobacteria bacterium]|nr:EAL domain-containing protein [Deltaproteobacteria bacterium]
MKLGSSSLLSKKLIQEFKFKCLAIAMVLSNIVAIPLIMQAYSSGDMGQFAIVVLFLILMLLAASFFLVKKYQNITRIIFVILFTFLWFMLFPMMQKDNMNIIFIVTYPLFMSVFIFYKLGLLLNLVMFISFLCFFILSRNMNGEIILNQFNCRVGILYLMVTSISFIWNRNCQKSQKTIESLALSDELTGLPNKRHLEMYLDSLVTINERNKTKFSLLFIDIDNFKRINDSMGHAEGDKIILDIVSHLKKCLRSSDFISRIGGDRFVLVLHDIDDDYSPVHTARRLLITDNILYQPTLSIGIANYPDDGSSIRELIQNGESAMFQSKRKGKNTFSFYQEDFNDLVKKRFLIEKHLRSAIQNNELSIVFQPKVNSKNGRVYGAEALVRWNNPTLGVVSPSEFMTIAEDSDLIHILSSWIYEEAFRQLSYIHKNVLEDFILSVNVSPVQIKNKTFIGSLESALQKTGVSPQFIELEITEGVFLNLDHDSIEDIHSLRSRGFRIAIDDFGSGYSSLNYLQKLDMDLLKIDRSFIQNIEEKKVYSIVKAVISMAESLDLQVLAEGVESKEQLDFLNSLGCNLIQGFYYSKPLAQKEFIAFLGNE